MSFALKNVGFLSAGLRFGVSPPQKISLFAG